jgi:hypothetical protein
MLSFDEFRAVNNREKAKTAAAKPGGPAAEKTVTKKVKKATPAEPAAAASKPESADAAQPKKSFIRGAVDSIGEFLELHQMQSLYVLMIILDTFVSLAEMYLSCAANFPSNESEEYEAAEVNRKVMVRLLSSFSTFTTFFFAAEIVAVVLVFGRAMMSHWGYLLDILTTGAQIYLEQKQLGRVSRLLNILRFWRMARLMNAMVSTEKDAHDRTALLLEKSEVEVKKLQLETASLRTEIVREKEARDAIEDMLQNYKEEVDTLNEALKIAAMDIAEVAQNDDDVGMSDENDSQDELSEADGGRDDEGFVDAAASKYSRAGNKGAVMRAVMEDGSVHSRGSTLTANSSSHNYGTSTFLVHEDGTFEQK